jgi:hypothetical protein
MTTARKSARLSAFINHGFPKVVVPGRTNAHGFVFKLTARSAHRRMSSLAWSSSVLGAGIGAHSTMPRWPGISTFAVTDRVKCWRDKPVMSGLSVLDGYRTACAHYVLMARSRRGYLLCHERTCLLQSEWSARPLVLAVACTSQHFNLPNNNHHRSCGYNPDTVTPRSSLSRRNNSSGSSKKT